MDEELKELLEENLEVSKENNEILSKIWSDVKWKRITKFIYWLIIIGLALGAYYYVQPIIEGFSQGYGSVGKGIGALVENIKKVTGILPSLLDKTGELPR
ncbi:hypothetical protein A2442_03000 [Candidatus Campbellbacteria bacterium RIFOXYC2_FULL_35_25]|uniref:Uncharacterized protein n=1 Tax=Candidatus Campbellbacteria bacterium RIFOXYC2_FULL_35_25 TaxID=1797582 RepID=A0A1F5EJ54_9BACT|nr:MAG: hypothetical protein A2442_03000 [Candidatus Campbellbacteria bacterium RIFOXYC2_FULL_35_25]